jgi:hypothetical protein
MIKYYWKVRPKKQREALAYLIQPWFKVLRQAFKEFVEDPGIMGVQLSGGIRWQLQDWPINPR